MCVVTLRSSSRRVIKVAAVLEFFSNCLSGVPGQDPERNGLQGGVHAPPPTACAEDAGRLGHP